MKEAVREPAKESLREARGSLETFPVSMYYPSGKADERACAYGIARRYTREGLEVRTDTRLEVGQLLSVRFNLPDALEKSADGLRCQFKGTVTSVREMPTLGGDGNEVRPTASLGTDERLRPALGGAFAGEAPETPKPGDEMAYQLLIRWDQDPESLVDGAMSKTRRNCLIGLTFLLGVMVWFKWVNIHYFWYYPLLHTYSLIIGIFYLSRYVISHFNKPPEPTDYEPSVTIVIAVRNEEKYIGRTIEGCFNTIYPAEKREVIVVNDGSTDGTPQVIARMKEKYPELRCHTLPPSGKRLAMATGVWDARGEIIVFVDSDTFLHPLALRHIVCGFEDPTLGAASGHTDVENADQNTLTRMQEIRYAVGYALMKGSESTFSCVSCCPGCLSAYRRA